MAVFLSEVSSEMKKDYLRDYLKDSGIIDKLADIFDKMIVANEKPDNPMDFIRLQLGEKPVSAETGLKLERELDDAQFEIRRLRSVLHKLGVEYRIEEEYDVTAEPGLEDLEGMEEFETPPPLEEAPQESEP